MGERWLRLWSVSWLFWWRIRDRLGSGEAGEGVVSTAIAVLIMAFLGLGLWIAFKATLGHATSNIDQQVSNIGK